MLMYWGDNVMRAPRGQVRDELVEMRDLLPTFLDAAGAPIPEEVEGLSMLHPVKGLRTAWRQWLDLEHSTCYWPGNNWTALVDARWKYIFHAHDGSEQLFDLQNDPQERVDLAGSAEHQDVLLSWRERMADHLRPRGEEWVKDGAPAVRKKGTVLSPNDPRVIAEKAQNSEQESEPQKATASTSPPAPKSVSGIYPQLALFNEENECGIGAVVPWADRLWAITYAPHAPTGSSDKLYEITPHLQLIERPESIGGTPANRMIHPESQQLFIGPYAIDQQRNVRVIPYERMPGRPTGNARHLSDPANKIYYATMEEGLYEVDVTSLEVTELYADTNGQRLSGDQSQSANPSAPTSNLPGYHGKGLYSGQGRLVYANNGEVGPTVFTDPATPSGALAEWMDGEWNVVQRNQFTEVTGPGGILGNADPANDPIWSIGWDQKSLILMTLDKGKWHRFRLPKASHSYDGAHGWNTEWPRIRDIGEEDLLMTMHGMFWRFPRSFSAVNTSGISARSSYLKVIGDFCRWQDRIVFGCDDTAKSEFKNKRKAKGEIAAPQSQSNLWFVKPEQLDHFGPVYARGAVWLNEDVKAKVVSDPMLINGFKNQSLHLVVDKPCKIYVEADMNGSGTWQIVEIIRTDGYQWRRLSLSPKVQWLRLRSNQDLSNATAWFQLGNGPKEHRTLPWVLKEPMPPQDPFTGMAVLHEPDVSGGVMRARGQNERTLHFAAINRFSVVGHYVLDANLNLRADGDEAALEWLQDNAAIPDPRGVIEEDTASVIYIDESGKRYRLPTHDGFPWFGHPLGRRSGSNVQGHGRLCREVATERDLFHLRGVFYELPAENAGGFSKIRPISSHHMQVHDFCSYRGMLVMSGVNMERAEQGSNPNIVVSDDGKAALWVGVVDDLWKLDKPRGYAGLWPLELVKAGIPSDPLLFNGFDQKRVLLRSDRECVVTLELDITGDGDWQPYRSFTVLPGEDPSFDLPAGLQAYWVRGIVDRDAVVTCRFKFD